MFLISCDLFSSRDSEQEMYWVDNIIIHHAGYAHAKLCSVIMSDMNAIFDSMEQIALCWFMCGFD